MDNHGYSPSEIVMLEEWVKELREQVIKLEREKFLLMDQVKSLEELVNN